MKKEINYNFSAFAKELLLYTVTMGFGLLTAWQHRPDVGAVLQTSFQPLDFNIRDFVWLVVFFFFFSFIILRHRRVAGIMLKIFFMLVIFSGAQIIFEMFFSPIPSLILAVFLLVSLGGRSNVLSHNIGVILGIAGLSSVLGLSLSYTQSGVLLGVLSVYDVIAVYKTRHMVAMAENMVASGAILGLLIPSNWRGFLSASRKDESRQPVMILGSGDVGLPIVFAVSLMSVSVGAALAAAASSMFGLFVTHLLFSNQKKKRPMAALPPIATASILGYLIYTLI